MFQGNTICVRLCIKKESDAIMNVMYGMNPGPLSLGEVGGGRGLGDGMMGEGRRSVQREKIVYPHTTMPTFQRASKKG